MPRSNTFYRTTLSVNPDVWRLWKAAFPGRCEASFAINHLLTLLVLDDVALTRFRRQLAALTPLSSNPTEKPADTLMKNENLED